MKPDKCMLLSLCVGTVEPVRTWVRSSLSGFSECFDHSRPSTEYPSSRYVYTLPVCRGV